MAITDKVRTPETNVDENTDTAAGASFGVKLSTLIFLAVPPVAIVTVAAFTLAPTWGMLALTAAFYAISMMGVTLGWHRFLCHGGFKAKPWMRFLLTVAGSISWQGSPVGWVATHRKHHQLSDKEGDPHTPHGFGGGGKGVAKGFWHAHAGWLFDGEDANVEKYAPDLLKDPIVMRVERTWWMYSLVFMLVIPAIVGFLIDGWIGLVTCVLWAGVIRVGLAHHFAWLTNSAGHLWGSRPFKARDESRNIPVLTFTAFGENWHNAHHAFPTSPRHGLLKHQWDPTARTIRVLEKLGWVYDVKWLTDEQVAKKLKPRSEW